MKLMVLTVLLLGGSLATRGADEVALGQAVETKWPGVQIRVSEIRRIAGDRLLFVIVLVATPKAPPATLIGFASPTQHVKVTLPPTLKPMTNAPKEEAVTLPPKPYSIAAATMREEKSQQTYGTLVPDPKGPVYRNSWVLTTLSPGRGCYLTIQFSSPPPPAEAPGELAPRQYVSLLIPQAAGAITHVELPEQGEGKTEGPVNAR